MINKFTIWGHLVSIFCFIIINNVSQDIAHAHIFLHVSNYILRIRIPLGGIAESGAPSGGLSNRALWVKPNQECWILSYRSLFLHMDFSWISCGCLQLCTVVQERTYHFHILFTHSPVLLWGHIMPRSLSETGTQGRQNLLRQFYWNLLCQQERL